VIVLEDHTWSQHQHQEKLEKLSELLENEMAVVGLLGPTMRESGKTSPTHERLRGMIRALEAH